LAHATTVRQFQQLRIISKGTVMSVENYAPPPNATLPRRGYEILRVVLGVGLLVTAALKAHAMFAGTSSPDVVFSSPRLQIATIEIEIALGIWLLSRRAVRIAWASALVFFALLASVSLWMAIDGQADCGCLGAVHANPWWMFGFDAAAVVALCLLRPRRSFSWDQVPWLMEVLKVSGGGALILVLAGAVFLLIVDDPDDAFARLRGESVSLSPAVADAGEGVSRETHEITYHLRNHTDHEIRVIGARADCRCVTTRDLPLTIPPGESRPVGIGVRYGGRSGSFQHQFVLYVDDERQPLIVGRFTGRVVQPVSR
jgi:hypothetical protein